MPDDMPPAAFILADAAVELSDSTETSLDDVLPLELERLQNKIGRARAMLENVTSIAQAMERKARDVLQNARDPQSLIEGLIEEQFDPEELEFDL